MTGADGRGGKCEGEAEVLGGSVETIEPGVFLRSVSKSGLFRASTDEKSRLPRYAEPAHCRWVSAVGFTQ